MIASVLSDSMFEYCVELQHIKLTAELINFTAVTWKISEKLLDGKINFGQFNLLRERKLHDWLEYSC